MTDARPTLDERKAAILRAIVSHYVRSGEPVGSKTLVEHFNLGVSPATVRNEMGALEEFGYIYQPHTSAGRIPTDWGYRFFVDTYVKDVRLPAADARQVRSFFGEQHWELEDALRQTAALLSGLTDHAAVVFAPSLDKSVVRHLELVSLPGDRAMVVVVTDTGRVENHVVSVPDTMDVVQLERAAEMLNRVMVDTPLESAAQTIAGSLDRFPLELRETVSKVSGILDEGIRDNDSERVFLEGTSNMVDETKFADLETVRQVVGVLEHRRMLLEVLAEALSISRLNVSIGGENAIVEMRSCAVVTAPYGYDDNQIGSIGIVGPTRMDYRRTVAAVGEVASNLGRMFGAAEG